MCEHACRVRFDIRDEVTALQATLILNSAVSALDFGDTRVANCQFADLITEHGLVTQRWQLQVLFERDFIRALLETNGSYCATPYFVLSELAMQLQKFSMILEVIDLLLDIDRCCLLMDMKR